MRSTALQFTREHLRTRLTLALLVIIPVLFVLLAGDVLSEFATALGGEDLGARATGLGAGWAAAFLAGALGYFQVSSSREADRRLALAGMGAVRVAGARLLAALAIGAIVSAAAYVTLWVGTGIAHPAHAAIAIAAFAAIYLGLGAIVASVVHDPLSGSLTIAFVFMLDVFSGPGMGNAAGLPTPSRAAGELLLAAGGGAESPAADWRAAALTVVIALGVAGVTFFLSARERG